MIKKTHTKKVLIALDYHPSALIVAEKGVSIAKDLRAEVLLLHIISDPAYYSTEEYSPIVGFTGFSNMGLVKSNSDGALKEAAHFFLNKMIDHLGDHSIHTIVKEGELDETIIQTAKFYHSDIIILGSHSRNWLNRIGIGSLAESVLNKSSLPVLIIPLKNSTLKK